MSVLKNLPWRSSMTPAIRELHAELEHLLIKNVLVGEEVGKASTSADLVAATRKLFETTVLTLQVSDKLLDGALELMLRDRQQQQSKETGST